MSKQMGTVKCTENGVCNIAISTGGVELHAEKIQAQRAFSLEPSVARVYARMILQAADEADKLIEDHRKNRVNG